LVRGLEGLALRADEEGGEVVEKTAVKVEKSMKKTKAKKVK
jgi:hypothetical protein